MTLIRRNQNWLPGFFNDFMDNNWIERVNSTLPAVNVMETENEYKVELAAPGLTKDDFNVHVDEDNNLVVNVEKKTEDKARMAATSGGSFLTANSRGHSSCLTMLTKTTSRPKSRMVC